MKMDLLSHEALKCRSSTDHHQISEIPCFEINLGVGLS
jgi:hypothetical protein